MTLSLIISLFLGQVPGMGPDPEQQKNLQMDQIRKESARAGEIYVSLFQNGLDAALLIELGEEFVTISKPVQSRLCFQKSMVLAESEVAAAGLEKSNKRLTYLDKRLDTFAKKLAEEKDIQSACSRAAILYHMGYPDQAAQELNDAAAQYGLDNEIINLRLTFAKGQEIQDAVKRQLANEFAAAVGNDDLPLAYERLGQLVFLTLGRLPSGPYIEMLREKFGDRVQETALQGAIDFLTRDPT